MRRGLALALAAAALLTLSGCGDPADRVARMEDLALLRVLAVDRGEEGVAVTAATGETSQQPALLLQAVGRTAIAACLAIRGDGTAYPSYTHLDQMLVGEELALEGLDDLLDSLSRDRELRLSSRLWLVRGRASDALTDETAGRTVERLSMLEEMAGVGSNDADRTVGDVIIAARRSGDTFLPALTLSGEGNLLAAGYGVLKDRRLVCYLEGDLSKGVDLILGITTDDVVELPLPDGQPAAVRLNGVRSAVSGIYKEGTLSAIRVTCRLTGTAAQLPPGWGRSEETMDVLEEVTADWAADCIARSIAMMQSVEADPLELCRRIGARAPWRWEGLREQWEAVFPGLDVRVDATVKMTR